MKPMESLLVNFPSVGKDNVLTAPTSPLKEKIDVLEVQVGNSSGADASCGWGYEILDANWTAGQWVDNVNTAVAVTITMDTTDAQDAGVNDFALTTTTNNDGFVVMANKFPNIIRIDIGDNAGSAPTLEYTYWNGSAWATLQTVLTPNLQATGDQYVVALTPHDAAVATSSSTAVVNNGVTSGYYAVRVRATTAPSGAALADELSVVHLMDFVEKVADGNATVEEYNPGTKLIPSGHSLVPFCSTANAGNWIKVKYSKGA